MFCYIYVQWNNHKNMLTIVRTDRMLTCNDPQIIVILHSLIPIEHSQIFVFRSIELLDVGQQDAFVCLPNDKKW